jgi:KDO2-lipid IV(A) lauroyltransferase
MKRLRYLAEYALFCPFLAIIDALPFAAAERFVSFIAGIWYWLDFRRRPVAVDNVLKSGLASCRRDAARIARDSYRHLAVVGLESLKSADIFASAEDCITVELPSELNIQLDDPGQGLILAAGHFGSWEIAAQYISLRKPVAGVTRRASNPYIDAWMRKRKPRHGFYLVPKIDREDPGRFLNILKQGHVLALMSDQHGGKRGIMIDFFGRPASTHRTVAMLHLTTRAPVYFGYCRRTGSRRYQITATGPLVCEPSGDKEADVKRILEQLNRYLEDAIRTSPEQYLWAHRRWR